jgi:hypothetical protein
LSDFSDLALRSPSIRRDAFALGLAMVRETKFVREQATKAERMRGPPSHAEIAQNF